ncbi:hypothetical protein MMC08_006633 [Hypocenomyce scalaris]|nr:hypothetical protein [Hypocenomyce scalaris]
MTQPPGNQSAIQLHQSQPLGGLQENSVYLILNADSGAFRYGVLINGQIPHSIIWRPGLAASLQVSEVATNLVLESASLCSAYRLGRVDGNSFHLMRAILNGLAMPITPNHTTSRTWTLAAIAALNTPGLLNLTKSLDQIEAEAIREAIIAKPKVEMGKMGARVTNLSGASPGV